MKIKRSNVLIRGIVGDNKTFYTVSAKQFFLALTQVDQIVEVDSRMKNTHGLETYHVSKNKLSEVRGLGINTTLLGYFYNSNYHVHYILYNMIDNLLTVVDRYELSTIKANLKVREFIPTKVKKLC